MKTSREREQDVEPMGKNSGRRNRNPGRGSDAGVALIVVLGFLSIMVVMAVAFLTHARVERQVSGSTLEAMRGRQLLRTALHAAMNDYSVEMARRFGIDKPKVALVSATEKVNPAMPETLEYALLCKMAERGQIKNCTIDGPLDIFLACDPGSLPVKGVRSPLEGDADILIFPDLESANSFYKGLMLFAGGELAGLIRGTTKPVVVMSRSESENSKFYCLALACIMAE